MADDQASELDRATEARREVRQLRELQQLPGWAALVSAANAQIHNRRRKYQTGPIQDGNIYQQQWELGEASGIEVFINLPQIIIDGALAVLQEIKENVPKDDASTT